jgi:hypothetical protein
MKIQEAISTFHQHQKANLKQRSIDSYNYLLKRFEAIYAERQFESMGSDEVSQFLENQTPEHEESLFLFNAVKNIQNPTTEST